MSQAIADAVANVGGNTADALNSIAKILEQFGINAGDMGITQGDLDVSKGESSQKSSVPPVDDSNIVRLNHVGGQIMITENGISTPMSVYDGMIPNDITEMLINMSMENQSIHCQDTEISSHPIPLLSQSFLQDFLEIWRE